MRTVKTNWLSELSDWFLNGTTMGGTQTECAECGLGSVSVTFTLGHRRQTPLGIPWRLLRTLLANRSREPVPALYVEALAAGTVLGIVLDVLLDIPWWIAPIAAVACTWLYFLTSAFGRRRGGLGTDLKMALRPGRALELRAAETERAFRDSPFRLLGLDESWIGERWLGGWGTSNGQIRELDLGHGRETPDGSVRLTVGVQRPQLRRGEPDENQILDRAAYELSPRLDRSSWSRVAISVDGIPTEFRIWTEEIGWVGAGRAGDRVVTLQARGIEAKDVSLKTVSDLEPYLEGTRLRRKRMREAHDDPHASDF